MILGLMSDIHAHRGDQAAEISELVASINTGPAPDLLIFAGDASHRLNEIDQFLKSFRLECPKCWIPGNHDIWVIDKESPEDTAEHRYQVVFPRVSREAGWHYLPDGPLLLEKHGVGVIGTIGWFSGDGFSEWFDADSSALDRELAVNFALELERSLEQVPQDKPVVVVTHHLGHQGVPSFEPERGSVWNEHVQQFLGKHRDRILLVVHGHSHLRYDPIQVDGLYFMAHPFGYPYQHDCVNDGYRTVEVPVRPTNR